MARTYWTDGYFVVGQGDSLHAQMCMELILGNAEAAYETASYDTLTVLEAAKVPGAASGWTLCGGPYFFPVNYDRDGVLRDLEFRLLVSAGSSGAKTFAFIVTNSYREPDFDADVGDPYESLSVSSTSLTWQTETTLALPRSWRAIVPRDFADSDDEEPVRLQGVWGAVYVDTPVASTEYAGIRVRHPVDVS